MVKRNSKRLSFRFVLWMLSGIVGGSSFENGWAGAGDPIWTDTIFDIGSPYGIFGAALGPIATAGGVVFATASGPYRNSPGSNSDIFVRAYDAQRGGLIWESRWDATNGDDTVTNVAVSEGMLFVAGRGNGNSRGHLPSFIVRAYDGKTGEVVWQDGCLPENSGSDDPRVGAATLEADGGRLFVSGVCNWRPIVRAYDARTGEIIWQTEGLTSLAAFGGRVFVLASDGVEGFVLRSHDAGTGQISWVTGPFVEEFSKERIHLAAGAGAVFVLVGGERAHLEAFDAHRGELIWREDLGTSHFSAFTWSADRLFVSGYSLRAYESRSGRILWEDPQFAGASSLTVHGSSLVLSSDYSLRVYDAKIGRVTLSLLTGGQGGRKIGLAGDRLFVNTLRRPPLPPYFVEWWITAYDLR